MPKVSEEYREARRAHILTAARRCFLRDGFHETSMQDLVAEAGVSSGAFYRYFARKEDVILAIATDNLDRVVAALQEALGTGHGPAQALAEVLDVVTRQHADDGFAAIALLVWGEALRNPSLSARLDEAMTRVRTQLETSLASPDADPPPGLAALVACVLPGYLLQLAIQGADTVAHVPAALRARGT